jgi:hypothetical protein
VADKQTKLSIVVRTVDQATARIKAINDRLDAITKPMRNFRSALSDLRSKSGLDGVISGFKGVASGIVDVLGKMALIGGVAGGAVAALFHIVDGYDELGDKAEEAGVSVDFLAQMRYAAERSGAAVETLDGGMKNFSKGLGQMRANTGRMLGFLNKVNPAFAKQLKGAKSNEEAFAFLAEAMAKIEDPAKRSALAAATLGDAALAPLLARGADGIKKLRDEHLQLAGSQEEAAAKSAEVDDALKKMKASTDGVKAALITGLAPALTVIVTKLKDWFVAHREDIKQWAADLGEKLPRAIESVVTWVGRAFDKVSAFVDMVGGLKNIALAVAAIMAGKLLKSILDLGGALFTATSRAGQLGKSLLGVGSASGAAASGASKLGFLGPVGMAIGAAEVLNEATGGSLDFKKMEDFAAQKLGMHSMNIVDFTDQARRAVDGHREGNSQDVAAALAAMRQGPSKTEIEVKIGNAPPGTSVKTKSTGEVDMKTGVGATP